MIAMSVMTNVNDDYVVIDSLNALQALWQMSIMTSVNCGVLDDRCLCCSPDSDVHDGFDDWDVSGLHKALDESDFRIFRRGLDDCCVLVAWTVMFVGRQWNESLDDLDLRDAYDVSDAMDPFGAK